MKKKIYETNMTTVLSMVGSPLEKKKKKAQAASLPIPALNHDGHNLQILQTGAEQAYKQKGSSNRNSAFCFNNHHEHQQNTLQHSHAHVLTKYFLTDCQLCL